jgi:methylated-DNA-[protein]-cysteine S-methyltransferase
MTGERCCYETLHTAIADIVIYGDEAAICRLALFAPGKALIDIDAARVSTSPLAEAIDQLDEYFGGVRRQFLLPLRLSGTPFQQKAWQQIDTIEFGTVRTYRDLACALDNPGAARAIGQAANRNPIPLIIPCHRVVAAGGRIGGFAPGVELKRRLLVFEGAAIVENKV